jgi:hypothetical protein
VSVVCNLCFPPKRLEPGALAEHLETAHDYVFGTAAAAGVMEHAVAIEWTTEEAADLFMETIAVLLDDAADDDAVRPAIVWEALCDAWAPGLDEKWRTIDEGMTAGELREHVRWARMQLAAGETIP